LKKNLALFPLFFLPMRHSCPKVFLDFP
jgi:hypothetical protein